MKLIVRQKFAGLSALAALGLLASCASRPAEPAARTPTIVWPPPPERARFAYERSISGPADLGVKRSTFGRFADWLTGETRGTGGFVRPFGIALDEDDNLCVTDTATRAVGCFDAKTLRWHRWTALGKLKFESPVSVAKLKDTLYLADSGLREVISFDVSGRVNFRCKDHLSRPVAVVVAGERLLVARLRPDGGGASQLALLRTLSSIRTRTLRVPEPVTWLEGSRALVTGPAQGRSCRELDPEHDLDVFERIGRALSELHNLDMAAGPARRLLDHLDDLDRKSTRLNSSHRT